MSHSRRPDREIASRTSKLWFTNRQAFRIPTEPRILLQKSETSNLQEIQHKNQSEQELQHTKYKMQATRIIRSAAQAWGRQPQQTIFYTMDTGRYLKAAAAGGAAVGVLSYAACRYKINAVKKEMEDSMEEKITKAVERHMVASLEWNMVKTVKKELRKDLEEDIGAIYRKGEETCRRVTALGVIVAKDLYPVKSAMAREMENHERRIADLEGELDDMYEEVDEEEEEQER